MARRGMDKGHGRGYRNIAPMYAHDVRTHHLAGKGIKSAQRLPQLMKGDKVVSKFTQAKGTVVSKDPFAVKYQADSKDYVRLSNPKYWAKGGKLDSRFRNFRVLRVAASPPKNARIRLQDIGRAGHSLRMAYYKDGKWHTYQFLISKADLDSPKAQKLIASIKSKYNVRGGKDMPVKEISDIMAELPEDAKVEAKPSLAQKIGAGIAKAYQKGKEGVKFATDYSRIVASDIRKYQKQKKKEETAKPNLDKLNQQTKRVETIKKQIAEAEDRGDAISSRMYDELHEEERQLREREEEMTKINVENFSDSQLKQLAIRHKDSGVFSDLFGSGNEFEDELVRRIEKTKAINERIRQAQRKPVQRETGLLADLF